MVFEYIYFHRRVDLMNTIVSIEQLKLLDEKVNSFVSLINQKYKLSLTKGNEVFLFPIAEFKTNKM